MAIAHQPGEIIRDKYRISDILGKGGVAITYSAVNLQTDSNVAIKVISLKQLHEWKQVELFKREAEVLAKLNHPAIPKYLDYFDRETETDQAFYIVQEQASGKSLAELVESGWRTTEAEVKNIAQQILEILSYLHSLEPPVIHRDIKPNNLILSEDGKIYLVDFGAVQNTYYNTLMRGSTVVGTYGYMAPEQFRGKALPATDLYSLGATLLYLLTHRSPAELPQDTLKLDFRSSVDISESFADWLEKILEPDIEDRYVSAKVALEKLFASKKKRNKKIITSLGIGVLAIGLIAGINSYKWWFLSRLGYTPPGLCINSDVMNKYLHQRGNIDVIIPYRISDESKLLDCAIYFNNFEAIGTIVNRQKYISLKAFYLQFFLNKIDRYQSYYISKEIVDILRSFDEGISKDEEIKLGYYLEDTANKIPTKIIRFLINKETNINAQDELGNTLLHYAVTYEYLAKVIISTNKTINTNIPNKQGKTPLHFTYSTIIAKLLITNSADVNAKDNHGKTPLFGATYKSQKDMVKLLIKHNADINVKDNDGKTVLFERLYRGNQDIFEYLIEHGADVNARDNSGQTPLHNVVIQDNYAIAKLLIKHGADVNARDNFGQTPLFLAKNKDMAKLLTKHGTDVNAKDNSSRIPHKY